jgi:hypothetical protein
VKRTFEQICQIEPRLAALYQTIGDRITGEDSFWQEWSAIKRDMCELVGFGSERPELGSSGDYDTAYIALFVAAEKAAQEHDAAKGAAREMGDRT